MFSWRGSGKWLLGGGGGGGGNRGGGEGSALMESAKWCDEEIIAFARDVRKKGFNYVRNTYKWHIIVFV